jgi:hypothetical protein
VQPLVAASATPGSASARAFTVASGATSGRADRSRGALCGASSSVSHALSVHATLLVGHKLESRRASARPGRRRCEQLVGRRPVPGTARAWSGAAIVREGRDPAAAPAASALSVRRAISRSRWRRPVVARISQTYARKASVGHWATTSMHEEWRRARQYSGKLSHCSRCPREGRAGAVLDAQPSLDEKSCPSGAPGRRRRAQCPSPRFVNGRAARVTSDPTSLTVVVGVDVDQPGWVQDQAVTVELGPAANHRARPFRLDDAVPSDRTSACGPLPSCPSTTVASPDTMSCTGWYPCWTTAETRALRPVRRARPLRSHRLEGDRGPLHRIDVGRSNVKPSPWRTTVALVAGAARPLP